MDDSYFADDGEILEPRSAPWLTAREFAALALLAGVLTAGLMPLL